MMARMVIRTVLDARPGAGRKYALQTSLLAASWRHHVRDRSAHPLEVLVLGDMPPALSDLLATLGVAVIPVKPPATDAISRTANKIVGLLVDAAAPVLLIDNDTCFVADLDADPAPRGVEIMAAVAGNVRVSSAQWRHIREHLGLGALDVEWRALQDQVSGFRKGTVAPVQRELYVNGGVVWTASPRELGRLWATNVTRIADLFEGHPLDGPSVRGSDMAGLATAIGTHGKFAFLDDGLNYRPPCFWMGQRDRREIRIVHMTDMRLPGLGPTCTVEDAVQNFWDDRVRSGLARLDEARRADLLQASEEILSRIREVISAYGLNRVAL